MILPNGKYITALVVCLIATLGGVYFCYGCTPSTQKFNRMKEVGPHFPHPTIYIVSYFHRYCCCLTSSESRLRYHYSNDWLIGAWLMFYGCIIATIASIILLLYYIYYIDLYGILFIYEWGSSVLDMILFDLGCIYILLGSYPEVQNDDDKLLFQKAKIIKENDDDDNKITTINNNHHNDNDDIEKHQKEQQQQLSNELLQDIE